MSLLQSCLSSVPGLSSASVSTEACMVRPLLDDGICSARAASSLLGCFQPEYICVNNAFLRLCSSALAFASLRSSAVSSTVVALNPSLLESTSQLSEKSEPNMCERKAGQGNRQTSHQLEHVLPASSLAVLWLRHIEMLKEWSIWESRTKMAREALRYWYPERSNPRSGLGEKTEGAYASHKCWESWCS